ncbi:hypothetical protein [Rodentibacter ratti]|uniref:hypothetical protein n=1 Tax=Rodentibacter ratti TaxID=1906745 RepID=UPI0009846FFA
MRFAHQSTASPILGKLTYNATPTGGHPFASLWRFECCRKVTTNQQTLRDYTFLNPNYPLEYQQSAVNSGGVFSSSSQQSSSQLSYENYDYQGRYKRDEQEFIKRCMSTFR